MYLLLYSDICRTHIIKTTSARMQVRMAVWQRETNKDPQKKFMAFHCVLECLLNCLYKQHVNIINSYKVHP